jgi:hypothetical protein
MLLKMEERQEQKMRDYHGFGFGSLGYKHFEIELVNRGANQILLSVIKENKIAHHFGDH